MFDEPSAFRKDLAALCRGMEAAGLDVDGLFSELGWATHPEDWSDARVAERPDAHLDLWTAAHARAPAPDLGLSVGMAVPWGAYDVIDYVAATCDDLGRGMRQLARYFGLITHRLSLRILEAPPRYGVEVAVNGDEPWWPVLILYTFGVTVAHFRHSSEGPVEARAVELVMPDPGPNDVAAKLGGPVRFGALRNVVWFDEATWRQPSRRAEPSLQTVMRRTAEEAAARRRVGDRLLDRLPALIADELADGRATLTDLAPRLGMSPRTLQRRLSEDGAVFSELVDQVRQSLAGRYLDDRHLSVGEVAWMLGYSEPSAFVRAFTRWTGTTPGRYRSSA